MELQTETAIALPRRSISSLLEELKLTEYLNPLRDAGFEVVSDLCGCNDTDLLEVGVTLLGHRRRLLQALQSRVFVNVNVAILQSRTVVNVK